jgi:hypothetical protein
MVVAADRASIADRREVAACAVLDEVVTVKTSGLKPVFGLQNYLANEKKADPSLRSG